MEHRVQHIVVGIQCKEDPIHLNYQLSDTLTKKETAHMVHKTPQRYRIKKTMEDIRQALAFESDIPWRTKLGLIIPRTPSWQQFGDVSLLAGGGFSIDFEIYLAVVFS